MSSGGSSARSLPRATHGDRGVARDGEERRGPFQNYDRVLNRAQWSSLEASHRLRPLLLDAFVPEGPVVMGIDETIERRRGERISAQGIYRDPVRSSQAHFVKASGLRWVCLMVLARIPWVDRVWALPFLTVLAPSERYDQSQGRRPQSLLDRARQMVGWCGDGAGQRARGRGR